MSNAQGNLATEENARALAVKFLDWGLEAHAMGENEVARALCIRVTELDPSASTAHRTLADIAARANDGETAKRHWRAAIAANPNDYWALIGLAVSAGHDGDVVEAIGALRRAVRLPGAQPEARDMLAKLLGTNRVRNFARERRGQVVPLP